MTLGGKIFADSFTQSHGSNWESWPASGDLNQTATWRVLNNVYVHDFNSGIPTYHPVVLNSAQTPMADFCFVARQRITQVVASLGDIGVLGFVVGGLDTQNYYIIQYAQQGLGLKIYRRNTGVANFTLIGQASMPDPVLGQWYDMRVDLVGTTFKIYVDGLLRLTASDAAYIPGRIGLVGYEGGRSEYDDVVVTSGIDRLTGIYTSQVFDAGTRVNWGPISWTSVMHTGTVLTLSVRTGDTPLPDNTWSVFKSISTPESVVGGNSRYLQYRVMLATTDDLIIPILKQVRIIHSSN